jgi:hypothetical protein
MEFEADKTPAVSKESDSVDSAFEELDASDNAAWRAKRRAYIKRAEALGFDDKQAVHWLSEFDKFLPDTNGLTLGDDLSDHFEKALEETKKLKTSVVFHRAEGLEQDAVANVTGYFRKTKAMQELLESESDLMFGMMVAERQGAALQLAAIKMGTYRSLLQAELVRRRALAECWKHNLPKSMLSVVAVFDRAGFSRNELRVNTGFFKRFVNFIASEKEGKVSVDDLLTAANQNEEQFVGFGSDELGRNPSQPSEAGSVDPKLQPIDETTDVEASNSPDHGGSLAVDLDREIERLDAEVRDALDRNLYVPEDDRPYPSLINRNLLKGLKSGGGELRADGSVVIGSLDALYEIVSQTDLYDGHR